MIENRSARVFSSVHDSLRRLHPALLGLAVLGVGAALALAAPSRATAQTTGRTSTQTAATVAPSDPPLRSGIQQMGIKLGYGVSDRGQVGIIPIYGDLGWSLPDVIDQPLLRHHVDVNWLLEGWGAGIHSPTTDALEFGINPIAFKVAYDAGQQFVPYLQLATGVMYTSLQDGLKIGGPFEFNEYAGAGLDLYCNKKFALTIEYRFRHFSNARIYSDNRGLDTQYVLFGIAEHPER